MFDLHQLLETLSTSASCSIHAYPEILEFYKFTSPPHYRFLHPQPANFACNQMFPYEIITLKYIWLYLTCHAEIWLWKRKEQLSLHSITKSTVAWSAEDQRVDVSRVNATLYRYATWFPQRPLCSCYRLTSTTASERSHLKEDSYLSNAILHKLTSDWINATGPRLTIKCISWNTHNDDTDIFIYIFKGGKAFLLDKQNSTNARVRE